MSSKLSIQSILQRYAAYVLPGILVVLSSLAFLRVWYVQDIIWDDNFWAEVVFECQSYDCFYKTGFLEMARPLLAPYIYALFWLYRNSEYFYIFWHSIDTLTVCLSPLFLFFFIKNLFPEKQELAFFSAAAFIIFHLDQTLPYASATNYRIGLLLAILSFFLTERGFQKNKVRVGYLATAMICAVLSHSVFIEATLTLEPARALTIAYLLKSRLTRAHPVWQRTLRYWYLFVLLTLPIIAYKLLTKPVGTYSHMYAINPLFFLEWRETLVAAAHYLQFSWFVTLQRLDQITMISWILGVVGSVGCFFCLYKMRGLPVFGKLRADLESSPTNSILQSAWRSDKEFLLLGAVFFILPTIFFQVVSRPPITILETFSSHAVISQVGYGMLTGWLLTVLYKASILRNKHDPWMKYLVAAILGVGIFFNSAIIDHYLKSWEEQNRLWTAFVQRFPSVPDGKHFVFDVPKTLLYSDISNEYSLEFQLNLLYATSANPSPFRRVTANVAEIWSNSTAVTIYNAMQLEKASKGNKAIKLPKKYIDLPMKRDTSFGSDYIAPEDIIFVYYRSGVVLVNNEISKMYPKIAYKDWLNKPFPELPPPPSSYPLRHKMRGPGAAY